MTDAAQDVLKRALRLKPSEREELIGHLCCEVQ